MIEPNDFKIFAIANVLKTMVGMLFAREALMTDDPEATLEMMRGQAMRIMAKAHSDSTSPELAVAMREEMLAITEHLFREIEGRVHEAPGR